MNRKIRVLHYADDNILSWAGPYIQLLCALKESGCENIIACRPGGTLSRMLKEYGFEVHEYKPLISSWPYVSKNFAEILRSVMPDIIHTRLSSAAYIGGFWGKKLNIPVLSAVDKFPKRKYYDYADLILPCSLPVYEYMKSCGVPESRMKVIHNAVDVDSYAKNNNIRSELRKSEGLDDKDICFLGMGRLIDWKGFDDLLKAFALFLSRQNEPERFFLWLAGDGPEKRKLESLAVSLNIHGRVKFLGFIENVRPVLWAADIYIHPSWGDEAFGLSLLEAMSAGLPSIASKSGGMTEILNDSYGFMYPKRDINALVQCMEESITRKNELSCLSLKRARDFDTRAIAEKTLDVYLSNIH